ncbi:MAG TPA: M20/M25/M40 family metallo-hydrolase, partial [Tepidisphaeraceae bacterium]|nr:M20/M25/M40 family metallo-hydrolase [Tepidisphaeraceae bacterium]
MSLKKLVAGVVLLGWVSGCTQPFSPRPVETDTSAGLVSALRADVGYLASEELEGRGVGTDGLRAAGDFIARRFEQIGLQPMPGFEGYFHNFEMTIGSRIGEQSRLAAEDRALKLDEDWRPLAWSASGAVTGEVVFAGYAINAPQQAYNDFADVDVTGKIVVAMRYEPHDAEGNSRWGGASNTRHATLLQKARAAHEAGASALILVNPPTHRGPVSDQLLPFSGGGARSPIPVLTITRAVLDAWLRDAGKQDIAALQRQIDEQVKPQSFVIDGVSIMGEVDVQPRREMVRNVIGVWPGQGPRAGEFVVVGAHYDHLGRGGAGSLAPDSTAIHHGADDNASGTAALLHVAERIARTGPRERSILFIAFTAEERGLIGSARFVDDERAPVDRIVAMINLDMVGRVRNDMLYVGGGGTAAGFESVLKEIDSASPLQLKSMGRGGRGPSDHASFSRKQIPVLFLFSGLHEDYHRPTDTADKINYEGLADVVSVTSKLVERIAAMPREQYVDRYDAEGTD